MVGDKQQDFATRMGFAERPARPAGEGVVADWTQLPAETKALRHGWTYLGSKAVPLEAPGGAGMAEWVYEGKVDKDHRLTVEIAVFNGGQAGAIQRMDGVGNSSNMMVSPFGPAPDSMKLGDWTAVSFADRAAEMGRTKTIFWVYCNVFAMVSVRKVEGTEVVPIARAVQTFMERHQVKNLPSHLPKLTQLKISPERVEVGQLLRAELVAGSPSPSWRIRVTPVEGKLQLRSQEGLTATYLAKAAGRAVIEAVVVDEKTLLSTRERASVEITTPAK